VGVFVRSSPLPTTHLRAEMLTPLGKENESPVLIFFLVRDGCADLLVRDAGVKEVDRPGRVSQGNNSPRQITGVLSGAQPHGQEREPGLPADYNPVEDT